MSVSPGGDSYYSPPSLSPLILSSNLSYDSPLTSTSSLDDLRSESTGSIPRLIKPKVTRTGTTLQVLKLLQDVRLNVLDLLKLTLTREGDFASQRKALFSPKNMVLLQEVLAGIFDDEKGAKIKRQFLLPRSIDIVSKEIHREMEAVKPHLTMTSKEVNADFIDNWDLENIMEPVVQNMPTFSAVFEAAAKSKISKQKAKAAKSKNRKKVTECLHHSDAKANLNFKFRECISSMPASISFAPSNQAKSK